jgi:hypothetical protein
MTKLRATGVLIGAAWLCATASCNLYFGDSDACSQEYQECQSIQNQGECWNAPHCAWNHLFDSCLPITQPGTPCDPITAVDAGPPDSTPLPVDAQADAAPADGPADSSPAASCNGTITCAAPPPTCATGEVQTIAAGCWTGGCLPIAACDVPPPCADIDDAADCLAGSGCEPTYTGLDCTGSDGSACGSGGSDCTCASYVFASCRSAP